MTEVCHDSCARSHSGCADQSPPTDYISWRRSAAKEPGVWPPIVYEDGTRRSNRKVPRALTGDIDGDKRAHGFLIEQDRDIAEKSGKPPAKIKSVTRSGAKKPRDSAWQKAC